MLNSETEKVLKKPPQFTRFKRHCSTILKHTTPRKLFNLIKIEMSLRLKRLRLNAYPYVIIVDPGNICNLKCPLCPTGLQEEGVKRQFMSMDVFRKTIDLFAPYGYEVILHNWGEPFLHRDILKMVTYCKQKNLATSLSSNLNVLSVSPEEIVRSGLEYLIVSLDGLTQDVYSQYRRNGNISKVLENVRGIVQAKRALKSSTPTIEWQFLVMKHNVHQIEQARGKAQELGVDLLRFIPVGLPFDSSNKKALGEKWFPLQNDPDSEEYIDDRFLQKPLPGGCFYLYRSVTITPGGKVAPCCAVWKDLDHFGDLQQEHFMEIWNNQKYQTARALFSSKEGELEGLCCHRCPLFEKRV